MTVHKYVGAVLSVLFIIFTAYTVGKGAKVGNDATFIGFCILLAGFMSGGTKGD